MGNATTKPSEMIPVARMDAGVFILLNREAAAGAYWTRSLFACRDVRIRENDVQSVLGRDRHDDLAEGNGDRTASIGTP